MEVKAETCFFFGGKWEKKGRIHDKPRYGQRSFTVETPNYLEEMQSNLENGRGTFPSRDRKDE